MIIPARQCEMHLHKRDINHEDTKNTKNKKRFKLKNSFKVLCELCAFVVIHIKTKKE